MALSGVILIRTLMATTGQNPKAVVEPAPAPQPDILPTLFGTGYNDYQIRSFNFVLSFLLHTLGMALLLSSSYWVVTHRQEIKAQVIEVFDSSEVPPLPPAETQAGGGGGGGDADKLAASRGALPKTAPMQITPPVVVVRNPDPKLTVDPAVVIPPNIKLPVVGQLGDPLSGVLGPPSNGTGTGGGIGSGSGGGVGSGRGPGVGPGYGGGIGGGYYRPGAGGVTAPRAVYTPDPEYSEEARKAKYQGTVILWVAIGTDGRPKDIRVQRSLGMGLDEKAIEAVRTWRFEPSRLNGQAVPVQVNIEVNFRLY